MSEQPTWICRGCGQCVVAIGGLCLWCVSEPYLAPRDVRSLGRPSGNVGGLPGAALQREQS